MRSITEELVFDPLWFFQGLEGERNTIISVFEFLKDNEQHSNVNLVALEDITERSFGNWWMALSSATSTAHLPSRHSCVGPIAAERNEREGDIQLDPRESRGARQSGTHPRTML